jgi:hypothetical protein
MCEDLRPAPLSGAWDSALLGPVAEINEQMLEWLRLMAASDSGDAARRLVDSPAPATSRACLS